MEENWFDAARKLAAEIGETILKAGGALDDAIVFVTDPHHAVGFDIAVQLLMVARRSKAEAERFIRTDMARAAAAGEVGASAGVFTRADAKQTLEEHGLVADPEFFGDDLPKGSVRMIALRGDEWRLEQIGL